MVTLAKARDGLVKFADNEIMPRLSGLMKFAIGTYFTLLADNFENSVDRFCDSLMISILDVNRDGMLDIDKIYGAAAKNFTEPFEVGNKAVGYFTFTKSDLEKLYRLMKD